MKPFHLIVAALAVALLAAAAKPKPSPTPSPTPTPTVTSMPGSVPEPGAPANEFYLVNQGDKAVIFLYGCVGSSAMTTKTLAAKTGAWLGSGTCQHYDVAVSTYMAGGEQQTTSTQADAGVRYQLSWDKDRSFWNIDPLPKP